MNPTVTVLMPAYNRATLIRHAIESVLSQTFRDFELLVIDDHSTDETAAVVAGYRDARIRLVRQDENLGPARTRNHGFELARGAYIAILDSDDMAVPSRLARQVRFLEANPAIGEVGGWIRAIGPQGERGRVKHLPSAPRAIRAQMPWRCGIAHTTVMIRAQLARRLRYDPDFSLSQDYDLHVRLLNGHDIANIPAVLSYKRTHPAQISRGLEQAHRFKKRIQRRLLRQLGLEPSDTDLDRHFALTRAKAGGQVVDDAYLRWADWWLGMLVRQNDRHHVFPEPEFSRYARRVWWGLGQAGLRRAPWRASRALLRPPGGGR